MRDAVSYTHLDVYKRQAMEEETESCLSLTDIFDDRKIKDEYNWNNDVYEKLKEFLFETTSKKQAYQIYLDTHTSIAFAAGRIFNSKIGCLLYTSRCV